MATPEQARTTAASEFRKKAQERNTENLVELPSGAKVILRRPSVGKMIQNGQLPSDLALAIQNASSNGKVKAEDLGKYMKLVDLIARLAFVSPVVVAEGETPDYDANQIALDDIEDSDKQFVTNYVQSGVTDLEPFRNPAK